MSTLSYPLQIALIRLIRVALVLLLLGPSLGAAGQIRGRITDSRGEALPFATAHIKGTTRGVSANEQGFYQIDPGPGNHDLVFQYIGYASRTLQVVVGREPLALDVSLQEAGIELAGVEVLSGREDPAYPLIRKAIQQRPIHRARIQGYQCRVYIKGGIRILAAPSAILGQPLPELFQADSSGFLYLSESEADFAFARPDKRREVMIASRVSGNSNGFSFNRFGILDFTENTVQVGRSLVNPIADNALQYYTYRLQQSYTDEDGRTIHQIAVRPRRPEDPVLSGTVYILEEGYRLHSLDLLAERGNVKADLIDTFIVQQSYLPVEGGYWPLFQQTLRFRAGLMGLAFGGTFTAVASGYTINPDFPRGFFSREVLTVNPEANQKEADYWEQLRPIPLTEAESGDYQQKDSLAEIRQSRPYLDSMDRINNRFKPVNLLLGYSYAQSWQERQWTIAPRTDWFNAVQGWTVGAEGRFVQQYREQPGRQWSMSGRALYGWADQQWRWALSGRWQGNAIDRRFLTWEVGRELRDFNPEHPFPRLFDAALLLWDKWGMRRYYDHLGVRLQAGMNWPGGWSGRLEGGWAQRQLVRNHTEYAFRRLDRAHPSPLDLANPLLEATLRDHALWSWKATLRWRPGSRYVRYPDQLINLGSNWPLLSWTYTGGHTGKAGDAGFHLLRMQVEKREQIRSLYGSWSYYLDMGHFLKPPTHYQDYAHFTGNQRMLVPEGENSLHGFRRLPYYAWSSGQTFIQFHQEWEDQHFLFDRIPGLRRLGWNVQAGSRHLWSRDQGHWTEVSLGIGRIGYRLIRPFSVHAVGLWEAGTYRGSTLRIGFRDPGLLNRRGRR